jgi:hypothetical protein
MNCVIWESSATGNACFLDRIENVERFLDLTLGVPFQGHFPANATFRMSKNFKKATRLVDDVQNSDDIKICSPRLVEFLKKREVTNVEYLPITILDHKGKVASNEYSIVHPVGLQDVLDLEASKPRYNAIVPTDVDKVERIVMDTSRIPPGVSIFRLAHVMMPVFIDKELAAAVTHNGFAGSYFSPLDRYGK